MPDEPCERRPADLDLVQPREQPVDRVGELLDVEHDGRHLADRRMPGRDEVSAPRERGHDGEHVGDVDGREPDRPQPEGEALRAVRVGQIGVDPAGTLAGETERLDGAAAVDRLAGRAREGRVRGALPQVTGRRMTEVPPRAHDQNRHADDAGKRGDRAHPDGCTDDEERGHARDRRLGNREPDRPGERVDVGGRARDEVADPGALHGRERQRQHPAHEVLAQLREHPLGEDERGPAGEEREDRLRHEEDGEDRHDTVDLGRVDLRLQPLHERPEEWRADEAGGGGEGVQDENADHRAAVAAREECSLAAHLLGARDRQELAHATRSSPDDRLKPVAGAAPGFSRSSGLTSSSPAPPATAASIDPPPRGDTERLMPPPLASRHRDTPRSSGAVRGASRSPARARRR